MEPIKKKIDRLEMSFKNLWDELESWENSSPSIERFDKLENIKVEMEEKQLEIKTLRTELSGLEKKLQTF